MTTPTTSAQSQADAELYDRHRSERHDEHACPHTDWKLCEENALLRALLAAHDHGSAAAVYTTRMNLLEWDDRDV